MAASPGTLALELILVLAAMFALGLLLGRLAGRARLPSVIGEITAGIALGPSVLAIVDPASPNYGVALEVLAQIGIILLIFSVGLETRITDLRQVGRAATETAVLGVLAPLAAGAALLLALAYDWRAALFVGAAMVATSVGITARVLADAGKAHTMPARIILGAAVIDDVLGMIVLAVVGSVAGGKGASPLDTMLIVAAAISFVVVGLFLGPAMVKAYAKRRKWELLEKGAPSRWALGTALAVCAGLAFVSLSVQLAPIIGAFIAGVAFADVETRFGLMGQLDPLRRFLAPFFFILMGAKVSPAAVLGAPSLLLMAVGLTAIAVATKFFPCAFGARLLGKESARAVGFGMIPRGEVGLIVAATALAASIVSSPLFSVVVFMTLGTSVVGPPLLRRALRSLELEEQRHPLKTAALAASDAPIPNAARPGPPRHRP